MINRIIAYSIHNKLIIILFIIALIAGGIWSIKVVPVDAVPDITNNQVQVITQAPNLSTQDIEQFITYPVEVAMANLPGVLEIRSVSRFGLSLVTVVFEDRMGTYLPRQLVSEKLINIREQIPEGMGELNLGPIATGLGEIYQYTLQVDEEYKDKYSPRELRSIQDWIVRRQMAMVPGVVEVNAFGGEVKQYEVVVKPDELRAIGLSISDVVEALELNNQNAGGAYIEKDHMANFIRGEGLARNLEDLRNIVINTVNGLPITVGDVAEVRYGAAVRYGAFTSDGQGESVGGMILMLKGANSKAVIDAVKERVVQINRSLPEGVSIMPFLDRTELIADTTTTVTTNLIEGALIVIFVLVFLLGHWRGGLIVASTIPLSLLFAFILMNIFDVWANLMSLGAIDFGIIVDGAVIIVEGTVFYMADKLHVGDKLDRQDRKNVAEKAAGKMMNAAFFGQLIILIVFLPILFLEGVEGKMFKPMALTFIFAMIGAMILCLTYVPMVSSVFIKVSDAKKVTWGDKIVKWIEQRYERGLKVVMKHVALAIGTGLILIVLAIVTFSRMGAEFIPQLDEGDIAFHIILKPGSNLQEGINTSTKVEKILLSSFPEIDHVLTRYGVADVPTDPMPMDIADCFIILKPRSEWTSAESKEQLIVKIKEELSILPGVNYEFTQPIEMRFNELLTGVREDIAIKLYGEDLDVLAQKATEIGELVSGIAGIGDLKVEATSGLPQITINYQRNKLAQYGLNVSDVNYIIEAAYAGAKAGVIFEGESRFDLVVRLDSLYRQDIGDVRNLPINIPGGAQIPLKEVAEINYEPGPMQISRDNTNRRVYVGINVRGRDIKSLVEEISSTLDANLQLPPGYYIRYGGAFENLERATERLQLVVPIALLLIFLLIFFALGSLKQTLMIYLAIPMATIGGVFALWLRDMPFSISAGVGFIVLFGVAVLNGLVLISSWNELQREKQQDIDQRIIMGARRRIRPILLTALTDILGFLPMAISASAGAEVQRPLATVVIGGMITSTLLTLFILPLLYRWVETRSFRTMLSKTIRRGAVAACLLLASAGASYGQSADSLTTISMEEAVDKALDNYPSMQVARLSVERQRQLKGTVWELGSTQIFTGGEELGDNPDGVYTTIGIQQQNIDILGLKARLKQQKEALRMQSATMELHALTMTDRVRAAYVDAYIAQRRIYLLGTMDSLYQQFEKMIKLQYEQEEISGLSYISALNQVRQISMESKQAQFDYEEAIIQLNQWFNADTLYGVTMPEVDANDIVSLDQQLAGHPLMDRASRQVDMAEANLKVAKSGYLPRLSAQYGVQKIGSQTGFYQFQIGVTLPLFFASQKAAVGAAKVDGEIAQQYFDQSILEAQAMYQSHRLSFQKWSEAWLFYHDQALPLVKKQRDGLLLALKEGEIDANAFTTGLKDTLEIELKALGARGEYMKAYYKLLYFNTANN